MKLIVDLIIGKDIKKYMISFCYYFLILTVILSFVFLMPTIADNAICNFVSAKYDYHIQCTDRGQIDELKQREFIDDIYSFSLISADKVTNSNSRETNDVMLIVSETFENMDISMFPEACCISSKENILNDKSKNPIVIDYGLSKKLNLSIGDHVYVNFYGENVEFTIAAIYQNNSIFSKYDAMILWDNRQKELYDGEEDMGYSHAYISTNDSQEMKKYLEEEFIPAMIIDKYEKVIEENSEMKMEELLSGIDTSMYYASREQKLKNAIDELKYTPRVIVVTSLMGILLFAAIVHREEMKNIERLKRKIVMLYVLGLSKRKIKKIYFLKMITEIIPSIVTSFLFVKFVVYKYFAGDLYLSNHLMFRMAIIIILLLIISMGVSSFVLINKLKSQEILYILAKDEFE